MATLQRKMAETPQMYKIRIHNEGIKSTVYAPLPDNFGMTVGSEFSSPFDAQFVSGVLSKVAAVGGLGNKAAGVSTTKFYSSPEPSEISFELQFEAYYDAETEVLDPIITLMAMSLGSVLTLQQIQEMLDNIKAGLSNRFTSLEEEINSVQLDIASQAPEGADKILGFIGFVQGPSLTSIQFGNTMRLGKTYISSVAPQFSNILDYRGYPMSATCNITAVLERDPVISDDSFRTFFKPSKQGQ